MRLVRRIIRLLWHILRLPRHLFFWRKVSARRRKYLHLLLGALLVILIPLALASFRRPDTAQAAWYDDNWAYRQAVTVTVSSSATDITDLDTLLTINTSSLISASKLQSSCQDLRFTSATGKLLPYYIDSGCNTTTTKVWIRADLVPKNTTTYTMYMYYGNPSASTGSDSSQFRLFNGLVGYWTMNESSGSTMANTSINGSSGNLSAISGTSVTNGQYSNARSFNGSGDYAGVNTNATLESPFDNGAITMSAWINATSFTGGTTEYNVVDFGTTGATFCHGGGFAVTSDGLLQAGFQQLNTASVTRTTAISTGTWYHAVWTFSNAGTLRLYINGTQVSSLASSASLNTAAQVHNIRIGSNTGTSNSGVGNCGSGPYYFNGKVDDVRVYNRVLSNDEVSQLYTNPGTIATTAVGTSQPSTSFATEETSPGPIAYWKFDEGTGTTAQDATQQGNDGTISGATWQTEDLCVSDKCLGFDGTDDRVTHGLQLPKSQGTISHWLKPDQLRDMVAYYESDGTSGSYNGFGIGSAGLEIHTGLNSTVWSVNYQDANASDNILVTGTTAVAGRWAHVTVTWDRSGSIILYVNGVQAGSATMSNHTFSSRTATVKQLGRVGDGTAARHWDGAIDEVKVYPYARSAAQVKADYSAGLAGAGSVKGTSVAFGGDSDKFLSDGLVGYWKMDNTSSPATDSSGNGNSGTWNGNVAATTGKFGNAADFDGSGDYIEVSDSTFSAFPSGSTATMTVAAWVKQDTAPNNYQGIVTKAQAWATNMSLLMDITTDNTAMAFRCATSPDGTTQTTVNYVVGTGPVGSWHHVACTISSTAITYYFDGVEVAKKSYSGGIYDSSSDFRIGNIYDPGTFASIDGKIDEARIYSRALSPAEVQALYEWAPGPVGYWKFDENSGTSVADSSGTGNTGTWQGTLGNQWRPGKYGAGGNFNGSNNYVRSASNTGISGDITATIEAWVKFNSISSSQVIAYIGDNTASLKGFGIHQGTNGAGSVSVEFFGNKPMRTASGVVTTGTWYHIAAVKTSGAINTTTTLYVNGVSQSFSVTSSDTPNVANKPITMGAYANPEPSTFIDFLNGQIDEVRIYNYARTQKQIIQDMNAGHPAVGSPVGSAVGHWKFDEGYGTTANNSGNGGSTLNGTLSGFASPATSTSGWTNSGKFGKALVFDGSNDYVDVGSGSNLNPASMSGFAWIKPDSSPSNAWGIILARWGSGGSSTQAYHLSLGDGSTSNKATIFINTSSGNKSVSINGTLSLNVWHHLGFTYDGTNLHVYLDGVLSATTSHSGNLQSTASTSTAIGDKLPTSGQFPFKGQIDEVKIYPYALTAEEVKTDYNRGAAQVLGALGDNTSYQSQAANQLYCVLGDTATCTAPVGEWKFEEGSGSTVNDTTGNANTGTWNGTLGSQWKPGKLGTGGSFNGSDNYVSISDSSSLKPSAITVEAWINTTNINAAQNILSKTQAGSYNLWFNNTGSTAGGCSTGNVCFSTYNGTDYNAATYAVSNLSNNTWYHVAGTLDGTTVRLYVNGRQVGSTSFSGTFSHSTAPVCIGAEPNASACTDGFHFSGKIDQARIYDYARSAAQIAWEYNRGAPVGHWKFDECQGTIAYDSSGNGNHGTITPGSGGQTALGTCTGSAGTMWADGATGKYNSSLEFDGTDDYVDAGTGSIVNTLGSSSFSLSAWIYNTSGGGTIIAKGDTASTVTANVGFILRKGVFSLGTSGAANSVTLTITGVQDNAWTHMVAVRDATNNTIKAYVNGVLNAESSYSGSFDISNASAKLAMGARHKPSGTPTWATFFAGQIDDARIYNYALNATQVKNLYNGDAAARFAPVTGSP